MKPLEKPKCKCGEDATHKYRKRYFCLACMTEYARTHRVGLVLNIETRTASPYAWDHALEEAQESFQQESFFIEPREFAFLNFFRRGWTKGEIYG